jgi:hypothetical protein
MSGISMDAAREAKREARQGDLRDNDAGIPEEMGVDYEEDELYEFTMRPNTMVTFDHIARVSINTYNFDGDLLELEQNLQNAGDSSYGFDVELTVANPEIVQGEMWEEEDPDDERFPDRKLVQDPESEENPYGVNESVDKSGDEPTVYRSGLNNLPGGETFDATVVDDPFDGVDYGVIVLGKERARETLGMLDTAGEWFRDSDGNVVEGLFEVPTGFFDSDVDTDLAPRLVAYPEVREDMVGQSGAVLMDYNLDDKTEATTRSPIDVTIFKTEDGEITEALSSLRPGDDAYAKPTYPRGGRLYWDETADRGADAEPQTDDGVAEARQALEDDEKSFEDLTGDGKELVDDAGDFMGQFGLDSIEELDGEDTDTDFDSWAERVEATRADEDMTIETDAEELARIIDERFGNE